MNAWSQLPNAHHIDWVLKSAKESPELWSMARWKARGLASAGFFEENRAAKAAGRHGALDAAWDAVLLTNMAGEVWGTVLVLIAHDDCDQYINMGYEKLHFYATISEKPQAILLLPMVYVWEKLNESMVTST